MGSKGDFHLTYTLSTLSPILHKTSYDIVPVQRAMSSAEIPLPSCPPIIVTSSPTAASGISVTSTIVISIHTLPITGTRVPLTMTWPVLDRLRLNPSAYPTGRVATMASHPVGE